MNKFEHGISHGSPPVNGKTDRQTDTSESITFLHTVVGDIIKDKMNYLEVKK